MTSPSRLPKAVFAISAVGPLLLLLIAIFVPMAVQAGEMRRLHGHLPDPSALTQPLGRLPGTNSVRLAISLLLRNREALTNLLQRLYDPTSPDYHHYLTPAQFSQQFGPTAEDYQAVIHFAESNGMAATTRESRMLLDVQGKVSDIEKAFHVTLRTYQHPTEARQFYAPDVEPAVDADLPILDIYGLGDYALPHPAFRRKAANASSVPASGSEQPGGYFLGSDFRNAYAPGVSLNGAGQMVGLLELDGYYPSDIADYENLAGLTNVPLLNIPPTNFPGTPSANNVEVALDIEMAIAMAPGLATVVVFEGPSSDGTTAWIDILDSMAASNQIKQFSSSWGYSGSPDPNTSFDTEFQKMATQGQSFYQASGDGDAWIDPIWVPADSSYLTSVGGTFLTMNGSGASYNSESVWNRGNEGSGNGWSPNENTGIRHTQNDYIGSGGGVSTVYTIPSWQKSAINSTNHGSTTMRNVPDVALTGDDIWVFVDDGESGYIGGTSCAAPLWAGFTALINQQATAGGNPTVGFINPAIYALGQGPAYTSVFHDITSGNDTNLYSHNLYLATAGYDLCTGWGTPNGAASINALLPELQITPAAGFASSGPFGGPFSVTNENFTLTNTGPVSFDWSLANTASWMTASSSSGTLVSSGTATVVSVGLSSSAINLSVGSYTNTISITDLAASMTQTRQFILTVSKTTPVLVWTSPAAITYGAALTSSQLNATASAAGNFAYTPGAGAVLTADAHTLVVVFTPTDTADYGSATNSVSLMVSPAPLSVTVNNANRKYGAANPAFTGTITGVTNGDNITAIYNCSATSNSPVGSYSIVPSLVDPDDRQTNYVVSTNDGTLTITMAPPLLSWAMPSNITYGTTLGSNQLNATANVPGGFVFNPPAGTVLDTGTNALTVIFTPADSMDYTGANDSTSLVASPASLSVTASNASQTYGQTNPVFSGTIVGLTNGDDITASYSCSATANSPVGTYPIVPSLVDPDDRQTNYVVSTNDGTLIITMAVPMLSWSTPSTITYGTSLSSNQLNATANVPGGFSYNPSCGAVLAPGTNLLSVQFTPTDAVDYSDATDSVSLVVSLVPIALNIQLVNNNVILSWNDPDAVFTLQGATAATGVFTNVPGAGNPYTNAITGAQQFFRLTSN